MSSLTFGKQINDLPRFPMTKPRPTVGPGSASVCYILTHSVASFIRIRVFTFIEDPDSGLLLDKDQDFYFQWDRSLFYTDPDPPCHVSGSGLEGYGSNLDCNKDPKKKSIYLEIDNNVDQT